MKTLIIALLCFITVNAQQHVWYVDRDANGSNNGTSWANAWKSLENVNWSSIHAGDTIYVSGGSDSTTYMPSTIYGITLGQTYGASPSWTYAGGDPVVICPARHSGHNGDVYFATSSNSQQSLMRIGSISNIKVTGFTFVDRRTDGGQNGPFIQFGNADWGDMDSLIFFTKNHIIGNGQQGFVFFNSSKVTVDSCYMEQLDNSLANDQDPIGISGGRGGHTISNNTIIMRNDNVGTDAHRDGIQFSNIGFGESLGGRYATERLPIRVFNNLIIDTKAGGTSWNSMIYSSGPYCNASFYVYNNILVSQKTQTSISNIWIGHGNALPFNKYKQSVYVLNNTIITKGGVGNLSADVISGYNNDTLIVKNNLFVIDNTSRMLLNLDGADGFPYCYKVFDYNHYGYLGGTPPINFAKDNAVNITWNNWHGAPYYDDIHSTLGNSTAVTFDNKYGIKKSDYFTTTGRGAGENLYETYPFLRYDVLGNERPANGNWDIGALQYNGGGQSNYINVGSRLFLQGPYNNNSMNTSLAQGSQLPTNQPYNTAPWNYNGNESLSSGSSSSYVDWVLVELRSASNPSQVVSKRAAILKNDGTLLETDGSAGVKFNNVQSGSYYVAVFHRNHLSIMSANPVQLSANSSSYDFTNAMDKAFGQSPMKELAPGKFGMYAGDGNGDGGITIKDRNNVWAPQKDMTGYRTGDFNLDGVVNDNDVSLYWNINNGTMTQVPN